MNPKQQRFVDEYLIDNNGAQAAIRAGYSIRTAREQASQILTKDSVRAYLKERSQSIADKLGIDATYVLSTTKEICDGNKRSQPGVALKAVDLLGKHLKLWQEDDKKQSQNITLNVIQF